MAMTLAERRQYHREWMQDWRANPHNRRDELMRQRDYRRKKNGSFPTCDGDNYRYVGRVAGTGSLLQLLRWLP